ncbi:MAG: alpha-L-fucosidase [Lachnospiraceae bacterium]|nr:alpha-L-fucosidase [Lachnospiraceae bacterium]
MEKMKWFREAKYGMFVHWGLYAELGGIWNGRHYPHGTEWIMKYARIPVQEYRKLADVFNPVDFDPEEWVEKAVRYGVKYLCFTAKHHDGFAMYDSKVSDYNIMHTPFGRDVVKELSQACRRHGIIFCVYYSQMQDWEDPNGSGNDWDYVEAEKDFRIYFENKVKPQVKELLTRYGDIGMIWFDTPYDMPLELCRELKDWVYSFQPDCIINGRIGYGLGDYRQMGDNNIPVLGYEDDWETPMTLNNTWGYSRVDEYWKSPRDVIKMLVDVSGKGGNLLLNVGPTPLGKIPEGSHEVMETVGDWLKINGDSIYGTNRCVDFPYQIKWGGVTVRENNLYLHVMTPDADAEEIVLYSLETKVKRMYVLATGEQVPFRQYYEPARDEYWFRITIKGYCQDPLDSVLVAELEGEPGVHDIYMPSRK